ncbi:hypothetical protein [Duganella sp. Root1480D1]|uniref:hypothetical protein n=1 Tax=Duganella sp. Root1480D1 TaxID=1736471 RepID=UPI0012E35E77|nr:hypothetical protein [Duganella sp. Root1480D1]
MDTDLEAYLAGPDPDPAIEAIAAVLGSLTRVESGADYMAIYTSTNGALVVTPSEDGYFSFYLRGCTLWNSDVEFGRFLSQTVSRKVRCDPTSTFPEINPYSDIFLEIENGSEAFVNWVSLEECPAGDA